MTRLKPGNKIKPVTTLLAVSLLLQSAGPTFLLRPTLADEQNSNSNLHPFHSISYSPAEPSPESKPVLVAQRLSPPDPVNSAPDPLFQSTSSTTAAQSLAPPIKVDNTAAASPADLKADSQAPASPAPVKAEDTTPVAAAAAPVKAEDTTPVAAAAAPLKNEDTTAAAPQKAEIPGASSSSDSSGKMLATGPSENTLNSQGIPPETTPPQSVAQSAQPVTQPTLDPFRQYLPKETGTVNIRRPFKLTVTGGIIHNLSFRDASVRAILAELARLGNVNILVDKTVSGTVTGELRDLTVNEALDSVLAAAGFQSRTLDNNTVIVASAQSMIQLGLNRTQARAFHLSYANCYEVAQILNASVFNTGLKLETTMSRETSSAPAAGPPPSPDVSYNPTTTLNINPGTGAASGAATVNNPPAQIGTAIPEISGSAPKTSESTTLQEDRRAVSSIRFRPVDAIGFNDAGVSPERLKIQGFSREARDFDVIQNNGGTLVVPDAKNNQIVVVGTPNDLLVAEEAIHLLDRRPKEVHIQVSLVELDNQAIRSLGATINAQGAGISTAIAGNTGAPLVNFLPGLGGVANSITSFISGPNNFTGPNPGVINAVSPGSAFTAPPTVFGANASGNYTITSQTPVPVTSGFGGVIGTVLPGSGPSIAGITASQVAQTAINFLTLSQGAGGRLNIATLPAALNFTLNMALQTNKAKLIANPSVVCEDMTEAFVEIADEIVKKIVPVITTSAGGTVVVPTPEITKVGIFLDLYARVTDDGFVRLRLRPRVSVPTGTVTFGVAPNQTQVTLESDRETISQEVRVKDGQTLVLAGLFTEQEQAQIAKVPYFAEMPVLGALFRNTLKGRNRTELMMLLTPHIVEEPPPNTYEQAPPKPL